MKVVSLSRLLGRQGMLKNNLLSKTKNLTREDDDYTGSCVTTNMERYYELDDRPYTIVYNRRRFREMRF
jgi:hypothetical protein